MEATYGIDAVQLGYSYKNAALSDFNLQLPPGRIALLAGQNGAGKTTLLSLASGNLKPDTGRIRICGCDPRGGRGRGQSFLIREWPAPIPYLSPSEALDFHARIYGGRLRKAQIDDLLQQVGLGACIKKSVRTFSKGMVRRLELACLRAADPPVWLLDEPQTGLDPAGIDLLHGMLKSARNRGRCILVATHMLTDIESLADMVIALRGGRTTFLGTVDDLRGKAAKQAYIVAKPPGDSPPARAETLAQNFGGGIAGPYLVSSELPELLFGGQEDP